MSRFGRDRDFRQRSPSKGRSTQDSDRSGRARTPPGDLDNRGRRGSSQGARARSRTPTGARREGWNEKNLVVVYVKEILQPGSAVCVERGILPMPKWVYSAAHPAFFRRIVEEMKAAKAEGRDPPRSLDSINWAPKGPSFQLYGMIECTKTEDVQRVVELVSGLLIPAKNDRERDNVRDFKLEGRRYIDMPNKKVNLTIMMFHGGFLSEDPDMALEEAQLCVSQGCRDAGLPRMEDEEYAKVFKVKLEESEPWGPRPGENQDFQDKKGRWLIKFKVSEEAAKKLRDRRKGRLVICGCEYVVRHQLEELSDPDCVLTTSPESLFGPTLDQE